VSSEAETMSLMFINLPKEILRNICVKAIELRNDDIKHRAVKECVNEIVSRLKMGCVGASDTMYMLKNCTAWVRQDGSGKYCSISFGYKGYTRFYIRQINGEYIITEADLYYIIDSDASEFSKMVLSYIVQQFNTARILSN